jgi:hypothetical protein
VPRLRGDARARRKGQPGQRPASDRIPASGGEITITPVTHATLQIRQGATVILVDPARFTPGAPLPFTPQPGKLPELPPGITPRDSISMWPVSAAAAAACARAFAPRLMYPYHSFRTDVAAFAGALDGSGIEVRVRDWYAK